ncbi:MAG: hypothetical protein V3V00_06400 [Saprospiraceae bacterium]
MILQTPTPNISSSLDFYRGLKFEKITLDDEVFVTDGKVLIKINHDRYARIGINLYKKDWSTTLEKIKNIVPVYENEKGYIIADNTGTWIYLNNNERPLLNISDKCQSTLGNYAGVSLETISMAQSQSLWILLGYKVTMGGPDQGWMTMGDENNNTISFMNPNTCPHLFFNPSLTYFNGKNNLKVIQNIRDVNIPISEEITFFNKEGLVDNIIIRDPGGLGFFIFSD